MAKPRGVLLVSVWVRSMDVGGAMTCFETPEGNWAGYGEGHQGSL